MYNVNELINKAKEAREKSYSPYSNFAVGAAILLKNGQYILGANIENVSFGLSNCAERSAMFNMMCQGYSKNDVVAMCVIGNTKTPISPCGACRQVMAELLDMNTNIILANLNGDFKEVTVSDLLPYSFEGLE